MTDVHFLFEGLSSIEGRLVRRAEEIGYIVIQDRTVPRQDKTLGRFDFTDDDARPYLMDSVDPDPESRRDADAIEEDVVRALTLPRGASEDPLPLQVVARAAALWIRETAQRITGDEAWRRFRVKVWSPKGAQLLDSGQFVCRNRALELAVPDDDARGLGGAPECASEAAEPMRALGDSYATWTQLVLASAGHLQGVNNAMLDRLQRQLEESRAQVDGLLGAILDLQLVQERQEEEREREDHAHDARHELAKQALQQFGEATQAFLSATGAAPEMPDVIAALAQSPDLLAALNDPDVRDLMRSPDNLTALVTMLRRTSAESRAAPTINAAPARLRRMVA